MLVKIKDYFIQSINELKKVNWPKRNEVVRLTAIVIISTSISMLAVTGLDWALTKLVNYFVMK